MGARGGANYRISRQNAPKYQFYVNKWQILTIRHYTIPTKRILDREL